MACAALLTSTLACLLCVLLSSQAHGTPQADSCSDIRRGDTWKTCNEFACVAGTCEAFPRRQLLQVGAEMTMPQTHTSTMKATTNVSEHLSFTSEEHQIFTGAFSGTGGATSELNEKLKGLTAQIRSWPTAPRLAHVVPKPAGNAKDFRDSGKDPDSRLLSERPPSERRTKSEAEVLMVVGIVIVGILMVLLIAFAGTRQGEDGYDSASSEGETFYTDSKKRFNPAPAKYKRAEPPQRMYRPPAIGNAPPGYTRPAREPSIGSVAEARFTPEPPARSPYAAPYTVREQSMQELSWGTEAQSAGAGASSVDLCPGLVVPEGNDCVLALPRFSTLIVPPEGSALFAVRDLNGYCMVQGEIFDSQRSRGGQLPVARLCMNTPSGEPGAVLASVRASGDTGNVRSAYIYNGKGDIFAHVARDPFRNCYVLTSSHIPCTQVNFAIDPLFQHGKITGDGGERMADFDLCHLNFEPAGEHFRIRVFSQVDVSIVLCGLLAIQHLEGTTSI